MYLPLHWQDTRTAGASCISFPCQLLAIDQHPSRAPALAWFCRQLRLLVLGKVPQYGSVAGSCAVRLGQLDMLR